MLESRLIERGRNPPTKKPKPKQKYTMNSEVTEPHTKYDNNPGNGVW